MKQNRRLLRCALLFLLVFFWTCLPVSAEEVTEQTVLDTLREAMPEAAVERCPLEKGSDAGTLVGIPHLLRLLGDAFGGGVPRALAMLGAFVGMALLGAVSTLLAEGLEKEGYRRAIGSVVGAAMCLAAWELLEDSLARALGALTDMGRVSATLLPLTVTLYGAGGNVSAAAAQVSGVGFLLTVCQQVAVGLLGPVLRTCIALCLVGAVGGGGETASLSKSMRSIYLFALGLLAAVATASLALQTALGSASDSLGMRTARFAMGQMIPTVGTAVGATLSTLSAQLSYLKGTLGVGAVGLLLATVLPPAVELWCVSACLSLAGSASAMLGFAPGERLFSGIKGAVDMSLAVLCLVGVAYMLSFVIFLKSGVAISP